MVGTSNQSVPVAWPLSFYWLQDVGYRILPGPRRSSVVPKLLGGAMCPS